MRRQIFFLLLGWTLALGWLGYVRSTAPTNAELWAQFQEDLDPRGFDLLILRGAFGKDGLPELAEWLKLDARWSSRLAALHPLEAKGLRERAGR